MRFRKGSSLLVAVVAVLFLLLPLLAYLQYDWLGKVSDREREQMQTSLRHTLAELGGDFDRQITRIFTEFQRGPELFADEAKPFDDYCSEYAKAYAHWTATARYPKLIRDIFLAQPVTGGRGDVSLLRLTGAAERWE